MRYALKIAIRYLTASISQTALLAFGVALGVFIFIFMSALIGGLANFMLKSIAGDLSHVTIKAEVSLARRLIPESVAGVLLAQEKSASRQAVLPNAVAYVSMIEALPGVVAVSPQVNGAGFMTRGAQVSQVSISGLETGRESAILRLDDYLVSGSSRLGNGQVLIGHKLAEDLALTVGDTIRLDSSRGVNMVVTVSGIYKIGQGGFDRSSAYVSLPMARTLFAIPQGLTQIQIKLADLFTAEATAARISALTGLDARPWTEDGAQFLSALDAQANVGLLLKVFAMVSIMIGIASSLLLSTYRRKAEIGIMRAMGASRRFVVFVFVAQGTLVGVIGGLSGAGLGFAVLSLMPQRDAAHPNTMPIDIAQGAFGIAIALTVGISILAAVLPARSAARVDPVTAIGQ